MRRLGEMKTNKLKPYFEADLESIPGLKGKLGVDLITDEVGTPHYIIKIFNGDQKPQIFTARSSIQNPPFQFVHGQPTPSQQQVWEATIEVGIDSGECRCPVVPPIVVKMAVNVDEVGAKGRRDPDFKKALWSKLYELPYQNL